MDALNAHACRRRAACGTLAALCLLGAATAGWAQTEESTAERQVKAAYLYKFTGYVDWPSDVLGTAGTPFTIGVLGADALASELALVVTGREVDRHPVVVRRLKSGDSAAELAMLYVGRGETARLKSVLGAAPPRSLLVVTEAEGAPPAGSMINFVLVERRVRFDVSLEAAERGGVRLSSRLLAVAHRVHGQGGQ